jgi:hypothetical protein
MPIVDGHIQVAADGGGKRVDNSVITRSTVDYYRQRINLADPETDAAIAKVGDSAPGASDYGLTVRVAGAVDTELPAARTVRP